MPNISGSKKEKRKERIRIMIQQHPRGITEIEVASELGMERRTVNNYLRELEREGWIYKDDNSPLWFAIRPELLHLSRFEVTPEEAMTLYLAVRLLAKQQDKRNEAAETALLKLSQVLSGESSVGREIEQAAREMAQRREAAGYEPTFRQIMQGFIYRKKVRLRYRPLNGKPFETTFATYMLEPSAIGYTTYLIGHSSAPNAVRRYKLERVQSVQFTQESYTVPADFPGLAVLHDAWSIISGETQTKVVLRFSPAVAERVQETQWHASQEYAPDPEKTGYLRWWATVADTTDMLPWIRGWGADVEVLEPVVLREKMMGEAKRMAEQYGWHVTSKPALATGSTTLDDFFRD